MHNDSGCSRLSEGSAKSGVPPNTLPTDRPTTGHFSLGEKEENSPLWDKIPAHGGPAIDGNECPQPADWILQILCVL
jgi:hypothetical protein